MPRPRRLPFASMVALITGCLLAVAPGAFAQVVDPRSVEFPPSPDHWMMLDEFTPAVTNYVLELYQVGTQTPFYTMDLGKPDLDPDGRVRYDFSWRVASWPLPGGYYEARVGAQGPYGMGRSPASNLFTFLVSGGLICSFAVSARSADLPSWGDTRTLIVTAPPGCPWTATSDADWLTVGPPSGTGSGSVVLAAPHNPGPTIRTGGLTVAGQIVAVTQALAPPDAPTGFKVVGTQK